MPMPFLGKPGSSRPQPSLTLIFTPLMGILMGFCCITESSVGTSSGAPEANQTASISLESGECVQVSQWNVASDVVEDFDAGLEYGEAESILKSVQKGDGREYLVR